MEIVILTAVGVGGATVLGAIIGFVFGKISHAFADAVLGFAAGIMLAAAVTGLILPSLEHGGSFGILICAFGVFAGALCVDLLDKLMPHLNKFAGVNVEDGDAQDRVHRVMLFVMAIAIHNIPEGIAAGVGFGTGNVGEALLIAGGIALQNIPEGMVIISPMLAAGIPKGRTFFYACLTGLVEVVGTFIGYFAVNIASAILPFALAFAGGTMLYVVGDEMIPETHSHGNDRAATYALIVGFVLMLTFDVILG